MRCVLCIRDWSVVTSAFVQRWRVYAHEPVFVRVVLFPLALVTTLADSDLPLTRESEDDVCDVQTAYETLHGGCPPISDSTVSACVSVYCVGECMCMSQCLSGSILFPLALSVSGP